MTDPNEYDEDDPRPRNLDAERAVLGAMMLNGDVVGEVQRLVSADDFHTSAHATIFTRIVGLFEGGQPVDPIAVSTALARANELQRVGGAPYLHTLISDVPTASNAGYYAELVAEAAARARLVDTAVYIRQLATSGNSDFVVEQAREAFERATASRDAAADTGAWVGDVIDDHVASWDDDDPEVGIEWPYLDVQDLTNGLKPGQLVVVAGRPGVGKSTVAMDMARHAARGKASVMFASLEMTRDELLMRLACAEAGVRFSEVRRGRRGTLSWNERCRVREAQERIKDMPLRIEDQFDMTLGQIRAAARKMARSQRGLDMLVVDHIGLVTPADTRVNRQEQVAGFSRGLKNLAKELAIPVIEVAQLNRGPEQRIDKKPQLSDLRESGALEQDADMVVLVYRPDAFEYDNPRAGEADLIVAKHRGGPTATITVAHQLHYCRFADLARGTDYYANQGDVA